ncbi:MAG: alkaline phosphatase family protein [Burkholderiales bacterium]|nr:alkaline phosphatase family protein [Burkholderiales bacterium]
MMVDRRRLLGSLLAGAVLGGCTVPGTGLLSSVPPAAAPVPRLVVLVAIDGLPMRQILAARATLAPDGFARFLDHGRWFANAHYAHGYTVTAAGHAVMMSGAYPQRSGIIGNQWRDPVSGEVVYNTGDPAYRYLGAPTGARAGTSPRKLLVPTLGDVLRERDPQAKVIGVSAKDRGAILPAGHRGTAYIYMSKTGAFSTSTYYLQELPRWVQDFNAARPAEAYFKRPWRPLLAGYDCAMGTPGCAYAGAVPDGQPWQVDSANGRSLPMVVGGEPDRPGPRYFGYLITSPFMDELTLNFARAAVRAERLGQRGSTDILTVSLSSHDYINHLFGPESRLSHDHLLQLDRHLQAFFAFLDGAVGRDRYVLALTADHGFTETPEWAASQGRPAGRFKANEVLPALDAKLTKRFGVTKLVRGYSAGGVLLDEARMREHGLDVATVLEAAGAELLRKPGVAAVLTREQLLADDAATPLLQAMRKSFHPARSAPLQLVLEPGWIASYQDGGSSHGSPYEADNHVPLLFWGPQWVGQGREEARVEIADLAPTLAAVIGVPPPTQAQGRDLQLRPPP